MKNTVETLLGVVGAFALIGIVGVWLINSSAKYDVGKNQPIIKQEVTGYKVWDAINQYRKDNEVAELIMEPKLCDNLVERWKQIQANKDHEYLEDFVKKEELKKIYPTNIVSYSEVFSMGFSVDEFMNNWKGSPGHDTILKDPTLKIGCAYAVDGGTVVLMARTR